MGSKHNQVRDIQEIVETIKKEFDVIIEPIINETFQAKLVELRKFAGNETKELGSSVMRLLQVEEHLARHLKLKTT